MVDYREAGLEMSSGTMAQARRFNGWTYDVIKPYLGGRILEIGCGMGNITEFLLGSGRVTAVDINAVALRELRRRLGDRVNAARLDIVQPGIGLRGTFDSIVLLNVLEHMRDERRFLAPIRRLLAPSGRFICLVPAHPFLYCKLDADVGHIRRYTGAMLRRALERSGFSVERVFHFSTFATFGYIVNKVLLKTGVDDSATLDQIAAYDRLVPYVRPLDRLGLPLGLSVIAVARQKGQTSV